MKFWKITSGVLAAATGVLGSGPSDGDAIADPNSAVVKLTADTFKSFIGENPLVLAEFFAPWCGYCKKLAPEFVKAANDLNESYPGIKLAQVDCTEEEELCKDFGIRGYPTLKVIRGSDNEPEDYEGTRESEGIKEYMIKQSLPPVQVPQSVEDLKAILEQQTSPFVIQVVGAKDKAAASVNETFTNVANGLRKDLNFISVEVSDLIESLTSKYFDFSPSDYVKKSGFLVVHPVDNSIISFPNDYKPESLKESLLEFIKTEIVPYFGDINRETYLMYMESPLPLAYYFYNSQDQRDDVEEFFSKLGKKYRGKFNFVALDASMFGRHAELLNMDPEIVPLFAIQDPSTNKKYGIDQQENPNGPSTEQIEELVEDFAAGKATPIIKSEPLPSKEEQDASPVSLLVTHNHDDLVKDTSKDVIVEYYAHWCGHCKRLAPIWDELGQLFKDNNQSDKVVVAKIDHSKNDVETAIPIEGYPTIFLYPANGEIDEATGLRKPIVYSGARDLESFIDFIKTSGSLGVDASEFKKAEEAESKDEVDHDEL